MSIYSIPVRIEEAQHAYLWFSLLFLFDFSWTVECPNRSLLRLQSRNDGDPLSKRSRWMDERKSTSTPTHFTWAYINSIVDRILIDIVVFRVLSSTDIGSTSAYRTNASTSDEQASICDLPLWTYSSVYGKIKAKASWTANPSSSVSGD